MPRSVVVTGDGAAGLEQELQPPADGARTRRSGELIAAARSANVMLVVIGQTWDRGRNRQRLDAGDDWVRTKILQAEEAG